MSGYSYTTISMEPGEFPTVGMHIYPDQRAEVRYFPATPTARPFLLVAHGQAQVTIGLTTQMAVTDAHVQFARALLSGVAAFVADCERLRDENAIDIGDSTTGQAAQAT
ncbi:hypothetical protein AB0B89_16855 [Sphaerisporangium sp. NPDC049002]|uniref:hypothetical protein n=1 Tax=Sphaerisporangium sp. NPDC049002 TaxID=3155392 RepID=UPI0033E167FE